MSQTRRMVMDGWMGDFKVNVSSPDAPSYLCQWQKQVTYLSHMEVEIPAIKNQPHYNYSTFVNGSLTHLSYDLPYQEEKIIFSKSE